MLAVYPKYSWLVVMLPDYFFVGTLTLITSINNGFDKYFFFIYKFITDFKLNTQDGFHIICFFDVDITDRVIQHHTAYRYRYTLKLNLSNI